MAKGQGRHTTIRIILTPGQRTTLQRYVRSSTLPAGLVRRARIVLLAAQGLTITAVAEQAGLSRHKTYKWLRRWEAGGIAGLNEKTRGRGQGSRRWREEQEA